MQYPINEIFVSIQGEGHFTGTPAIFVRFQGCPVGCPWCDTKYTWRLNSNHIVSLKEIENKNPKKPNKNWAWIESLDILRIIENINTDAKHIVITGGEPCWHDLVELTSMLEQKGYFCQIETSATLQVKCSEKTWVTVSPKVNMTGKLPLCVQALKRADEIKYPVVCEKDVEQLDCILQNTNFDKKPHILLQPVSKKEEATNICIKNCAKRNWRLSIQTHKYLNIP